MSPSDASLHNEGDIGGWRLQYAFFFFFAFGCYHIYFGYCSHSYQYVNLYAELQLRFRSNT